MIDLGVMNDLADDKKPAIFKNFARCVSKIDCALDAVAKTELFRQTHGGVADRNDSAGAPDFFDNVAPIMRLDLLLHCGHYIRRAQIHFLARGCATGNQVRAHVILVILSGAKNLGFILPERAKQEPEMFAALNMT